MTPEKEVQNKIMSLLEELKKDNHPVLIERRNAGGFGYKTGMPDLFFVYNGIHVEIEVKKLGGKLSTLQIKRKRILRSLNILYACVESIEEFERFLKYKVGVKYDKSKTN